MIHSIIDTVINKFAPLSFVDKYGGIVYPLQKKVIDQNGNAVIKTMPIYGNNKDICRNEDYIDLVPDQRHKSVIYFECTPETVTQELGNKITTNCTLTLVAWFNLPKINQAFTSDTARLNTEAMLRNLIYLIKSTYNYGDTHAVIITQQINYRDPAIFSRWSYDEAEKQYLIYPFDFGAVTFDVQLTYPVCDAEPNIDPDCFNS